MIHSSPARGSAAGAGLRLTFNQKATLMNDIDLQKFIHQHSCRGEIEENFLSTKICSLYKIKNGKHISRRHVINILRRMFPVERRGKFNELVSE
ncbi:MAG: hypothetical protein KDA52_13675, partial [Planctomycetaceae bacterium]|nr:hypothetical protein [Planctomycetaceae bacterium]